MAANTTPATTAPVMNVAADPAVTVLDAAGCALVPADYAFRWDAHRAEISADDAEAGLVAAYNFDKTAEVIRFEGDPEPVAPDVHGADEITEERLSALTDVMDRTINIPGHGWHAIVDAAEDIDTPGVIARVRFLWMTDEAAAEAGMYPW
ncbi:hypothetical protein J4573_44355 [Actinomadura barringtoniae]|uniref:Uncharacterized protein n=1 Tax=Actinomadura barringtoniae TaxID=1427535 RepID=A0A939PK96_9ACTN|nr:hypothetical protein [Actinomadura barringtoniae]MBO2454185.1 hypothetical protein [Actinomadura barringtoniae]